MTIDKNDPRLTAFALGELASEEAAELAATVEKDPSLQAEVAAIRKMAEKLKTTLAAEPLPTADPPRPLHAEKRKISSSRWLIDCGVVAVVFLVLASLVMPARHAAREAARRFTSCFSSEKLPPAASVSAADAELADTGNLRYSQPQDVPIDGVKYWDENNDKYAAGKKISMGRESTSMQMMVNPRIIIAEEEEEKLGRSVVVGMDTPKKLIISGDESIRRQDGRFNTESYDKITENEFQRVSDHPLSTFSIDVDTASYSMVRRMLLEQARMPVPGAVRLEEMINYFDYEYEPPTDDRPFATHVDSARCPWNEGHNLLRIGLKGRVIDKKERDAANLVFLLDVSGSMNEPNKLPLLKESMKMLVENLNEKDRAAIVVYAGASGLVLPSTGCGDKQKILDSLDRLQAGGSTNGGAGITLAYATAAANYIRGGTNRVVLCTDGDFNVGTTNQSELVEMIEKKAKEGVFLTVLGFGMGNFKDSTLEKLADRGNGNYGYVDTPAEARKLLVEGLSGTLVTIAKDVKIQVEFNPAQVKAYRLLGYENRMLKKEDFNDDTKDAGEIGAGHTVTALYEIIPADSKEEIAAPKVDALKYQAPSPVSGGDVHDSAADASAPSPHSQEMLTVKLRYKEPDGEKSKLLEFPCKNAVTPFDEANNDLRFAASAAAFGMLLRGSAFKGNAGYDKVLAWAENSLGKDEFGYRNEFLKLVRAAKSLSNK